MQKLVKCIANETFQDLLTENKHYSVIEESKTHYKIRNDKNKISKFFKNRFKEIKSLPKYIGKLKPIKNITTIIHKYTNPLFIKWLIENEGKEVELEDHYYAKECYNIINNEDFSCCLHKDSFEYIRQINSIVDMKTFYNVKKHSISENEDRKLYLWDYGSFLKLELENPDNISSFIKLNKKDIISILNKILYNGEDI